jgi:hypothetical protein
MKLAGSSINGGGLPSNCNGRRASFSTCHAITAHAASGHRVERRGSDRRGSDRIADLTAGSLAHNSLPDRRVFDRPFFDRPFVDSHVRIFAKGHCLIDRFFYPDRGSEVALGAQICLKHGNEVN